MKKFVRLHLRDFLLLFIILTFSLYIWYPLTNFALTGLGFVYLTKSFQITHLGSINELASFYWFPIVQGIIFSKLFTTHISFYFWTEIIFMLATFVLYYSLIATIFNNRIITFIATLMFAINFFGYVDIYASGLYPWFQERIPLMLLLIPSFLFLHKYLTDRIKKYLIYSYILYFIGLGIAHWGILFTAPYLFYPIFWFLFQKDKKSKNILTAICIGGTYTAITLFFIIIQNWLLPSAGPSWGFIDFLTHPNLYMYPQKIFLQLVYWSSYLPIFEIFKKGYPLQPTSPLYFFLSPKPSLRYAIYIAIIYPIVTMLIYIKLPTFRALLFTVILSTLSIFYLNAYFGRYEILTQPGSNRYLYLPTYLLVIFWVLFILALLQKSKKKVNTLFYKSKILICFLFVVTYLLLNSWLIKDSLAWKNEIYGKINILWDYAVKKTENLPKNTLVVVPFKYIDPQGTAYLNDQVKSKDIIFITTEEDWIKVATSSSITNVVKIEYDEICRCAKDSEVKNLPTK